ncbi:MAG: energy transducer TonB [Gammaproteobacteria bacterium]
MSLIIVSRSHWLPALTVLAMCFSITGCATPVTQPSLPDRPPAALAPPSASYPIAALATCASGFVRVEFTLGADGAVQDAVVVESQPSDVFDQAALRSVRGMSWRPAVRDGQTVATAVSQVVDFGVPPSCVPFDAGDPVDEAFNEDQARNVCFESGGNRWDFAQLQFAVADSGYATQVIVTKKSTQRMADLAVKSLAKQQFDPEFVGQTLTQEMEHCSR